jgi:putative PIN family toxin of toxin-antitoxin system
LCENASVVEPDQVPANACRDRTDLAVLGTAVSASADCLITGDKDLLDLRKYRGVPIVSPREFYTRL